MKLVRENLNEKFTEDDSDPIHDMGIGIYAPRIFSNIDEFVEYVILILPLIYDGEIPKDILQREGGGTIPNNVYENICDFMKKYKHRIKGARKDESFKYNSVPKFKEWTKYVKARLKEMGFKEKTI